MKDNITVLDDFTSLLHTQVPGPLVSLYMPLSIGVPDEIDRIQIKNLISEASRALEKESPSRVNRLIVKNLEDLAEDLREAVGPLGAAGLAAFVDTEKIRLVRLMCGLEPRVVVGDYFYTKPLLRSCQYGAHFILLGLSSDRFSLVHVDFGAFKRMELPPGDQSGFSSVFEADEGAESTLNYPTSEERITHYWGYKSRNDVKKEEAEKFFRYLNKVVTEWLTSEGDALPVVLVGLPEHQALFRTFSTVPHVLNQGIEQPFESLSTSELLEQASSLIDSERLERIEELLANFGTAHAHGRASNDAAEIAQALFNRRVGSLFLEEGRIIPGAFDENTGRVAFDEGNSSADPDLSGAFVRVALEQAADVFIIDDTTMPNNSGVMAFFRY